MELEEHVGKIHQKLKDVSPNMVIVDDITVGEIVNLLINVRSFIDYCKFEFGNDITGDS